MRMEVKYKGNNNGIAQAVTLEPILILESYDCGGSATVVTLRTGLFELS